jgi:hypothetical protein
MVKNKLLNKKQKEYFKKIKINFKNSKLGEN